ncbi:MAG TPA: DNA ligase D [Clostridiales bacterium]|jgi:bifunctional non-homologous end joining protein LigD|nr:DNA ligase D [Clostridiales bacterium]
MSMKLLEYNEKRDFSSTAEPIGKEAESEDALRFVVQHHLARNDHYDLRLEWSGVLLSWAVPKGPSYNVKDKRLAVQVEDHPLEYRNFEGTIPKGEYGGGTVMLWDEGFWEPFGNVEEGLNKGSLKFALKGRRLKGSWALVRMKAREGEARNWLLIKEKDEYAKEDSGISGFDTSVRTGRSMEEIEQGQGEKFVKNPFNWANVQLAKLVSSVPEGDDWLYELKYDGYRMLAFVEGGSVRLLTRNGNDYTSRFWPVASSLLELAAGRAMVLDGEMVVTDESGKTDFQALQSYMENPRPHKLSYIVFDLLAFNGLDIRSQPLIQRKEALLSLMQNAPKTLHYSQHVRGKGEESFRAACELGMEGIVGKKAESIYSGTRNGDWIKLKCDRRQEFVIGGYTLSEKKTGGISSLLLGAYDGDDLIYVGRAGTGFSEAVVKELLVKFGGIIRPDSPFKSAPAARSGERITWLEPKLIAEIKFAEWTKENLLRQASYKGLRSDKEPGNVKMELTESIESISTSEEPEIKAEAKGDGLIIEGVRISSPDKVIFEEPEITKAEVVRYYAEVAERMLPYVRRRILSIVRCPKGISESCFYKKHPGPGAKGVVTIPVADKDGNTEEYFYIEDKSGLIFEAQMGTLEFHTWGSSVDELERPNMMVFDLDPDEGMSLDMVRQGVRDLKAVLTELSLNSYLKVSGGKGYHVVVPLKPAATWDTVHDFARSVAEVMEKKWPGRYTSNVRKASRKNKIFIDWIRNGRGATSIAPYSIRARKGAAVSMPVSWDELDLVAPNGINMQEALRRIKQDDPWEGFFENGQQLR